MTGFPENDPSPTATLVLAALALVVLVVGALTVVRPELEDAPDDAPDAAVPTAADAGR